MIEVVKVAGGVAVSSDCTDTTSQIASKVFSRIIIIYGVVIY